MNTFHRSVTTTSLACLATWLGACSATLLSQVGSEAATDTDLVLAESFIDAFYSFEPDRL